MARGFTPFIGLAVVMALALAAVFGSMSLANPAMAQDPPDDTVMVYSSLNVDYNLEDLFGAGNVGTQAARYTVSGSPQLITTVETVAPTADGADLTSPDDFMVELGVIATTALQGDSASGMITITDKGNPVTEDDVERTLAVTVMKSSDAERLQDDQSANINLSAVKIYTDHTRTVTLDVGKAFKTGMGTGQIAGYAVTSTGVADPPEFTVTDSMPGTTANSLALAATTGTDGMVELETMLDEAAAAIGLSVVAICQNSKDTYAACSNADAPATAVVTIEPSTSASPMGSVMPRDVTIGTPDTFDVTGYFSEGDGTGSIANYSAMSDEPTIVFAAADQMGMVTLTPFATGAAVVKVYAIDEDGDMTNNPMQTFVVTVVAPTTVVTPPEAFPVSLEMSSTNPGKNASYTFKFNASKSYSPGFDHIIIQLSDGDFQVPEVIPTSTVSIKAGNKIASPADISVDDTEITLVLGDMDGDADGVQGIAMGENVTVAFRTAAGIKNPEEGGDYDEDLEIDGQTIPALTIKRTISLSEDEGGRGDEIMVTGKGFKNGTSVTFLRMKGAGMTAADFAEGTLLCAGLASDGVASCSFTVTSPLFMHGDNFINAVDGRSNRGSESEPFNLEPSISVSPGTGSPGESLLVQLYDFAPGASVTAVKIARRTLCVPNAGGAVILRQSCPADHSAWQPNGLSFRVVIPNDAPLGRQDLQVVTTGGSDNTNVTITGPLITSTPSTVLANQRVSLVGNGFTAGSVIREITFAGEPIGMDRIAGGDPVRVDGGGNWSASVNLPLNTSTVSSGEHVIQVTDMGGRVSGVKVTVPERKVTITPERGRVGTIAVVRGENFPSKNDEANSFNVQIVYGSGSGSTTVSAVPDASGRFEAQLRIPTTAAIPSTNDVSVSFGSSGDGTGGPYTINVSHQVPEGVITLSATSGGPGSTITVNGEGFRSFVPVRSVMIGSIDITPAPRPSTDVNGMLSFDALIPGLDVGIQTVEVQVGQTTASVGFTVTESGVNPGDISPVAEGLEPLGDNLDVIWHFNNDTKAWTFYDGQDGSDLTHVITGETYLIQVKSTVEVILNRDTRSLTCVGGNCWNQIVW